MKKILLCFVGLIVGVLVLPTAAQQPSGDNQSWSGRLILTCDPRFQKIMFSDTTFCVPDEFKKVKGKCYDSKCITFEAADSLLTVLGYEIFPRAEKEYPSYSESQAYIADFDIWLWSFETSGAYGFAFGARLKQSDSDRGMLSFSLASKNPAAGEVLERIAKTVKKLPNNKQQTKVK